MKKALAVGIIVAVLLGLSFGKSLVVAGESANEVSATVESVNTNTVVNNWDYEEQVPMALPVEYYHKFESDIFDCYLEECEHYCSDCDYYYYELCNCESCCEDCDFELFIGDNYDMIMEYYDFLLEVAQEQFFKNQEEGRQLCFENF